MMTLHMGPNTLVLNMDLTFKKTLNAEEVAEAVNWVEKQIQEEHPEVRFIFIEAKSLTGGRAAETESN
jgi:divalent metal cation (Fe/Co/Zn/Cd) transporter